MEKQEIFKIVMQARQALEPGHPYAATLKNKPSDDTYSRYQKCAEQFFSEDEMIIARKDGSEEIKHVLLPKDAEQIIERISAYESAATIRLYATAVRRVSMEYLKDILTRIDRYQKADKWKSAYRMATSAYMDALITLAQTLPAEYLKRAKAPKPRVSKKSSIKGLPHSWREDIIAGSSEKYQLAVTVLALTGCRPSEVVKGVRVTIRNGELYAEIKGAKVTEHAGQEIRTLKLHQKSALQLLLPWMNGADEITVQVPNANSLTTHIRNVARRLWPCKRDSVTSYSLRHAMAADCKASPILEAEPELISQILGHRVDKTRSYYGDRSQGNGRLAPQQVTATHPVKITEKSLRRLPGKSKNRNMAMK